MASGVSSLRQSKLWEEFKKYDTCTPSRSRRIWRQDLAQDNSAIRSINRAKNTDPNMDFDATGKQMIHRCQFNITLKISAKAGSNDSASSFVLYRYLFEMLKMPEHWYHAAICPTNKPRGFANSSVDRPKLYSSFFRHLYYDDRCNENYLSNDAIHLSGDNCTDGCSIPRHCQILFF